MRTAAAYIRVSTDGQLEYSPDSQLKVIRDYAQKHDFLLPEAYIFREEEGISGKEAKKRPAFMRMIGIAKQKPKPFDCIILWKFSRFARSRRDSIVYKTMPVSYTHLDVYKRQHILCPGNRCFQRLHLFIEVCGQLGELLE